MTQVEPTLPAPMPPSSIDFAAVFVAQAEQAAREAELRPANKDRLFDALTAAGISHVTVTFDGEGDSGQIESIAAWAGETAVDFPAVEIPYAAITWDSPEVEMRQLSLEDVVEQLAYDFLSDTHGGWENNGGAYGEFCFDASSTNGSRRPHSSPMNFEGAAMAHPYHHALSSVKKWGGTVEDYQAIHAWYDSSKAHSADFRHRAMFHHAAGIWLSETVFGPTITLSTGRIIPTRWVGEQHVREDLGFIPSFTDWVKAIRPEPWMGRTEKIEALVDPQLTPPVVEVR
jgi:hypothetical protein